MFSQILITLSRGIDCLRPFTCGLSHSYYGLRLLLNQPVDLLLPLMDARLMALAQKVVDRFVFHFFPLVAFILRLVVL